MSVVKGVVEVLDPIGLHVRPASQIVKLVKEHSLDVTIGRKGEEAIQVNSALKLMALKVKSGEKLNVAVATTDKKLAKQLISEIQDFLKG